MNIKPIKNLIINQQSIENDLGNITLDANNFYELFTLASETNPKAAGLILKKYINDHFAQYKPINMEFFLLFAGYFEKFSSHINAQSILEKLIFIRTENTTDIQWKYHCVDFLISQGANLENTSFPPYGYQIQEDEIDYLIPRNMNKEKILSVLLKSSPVLYFLNQSTGIYEPEYNEEKYKILKNKIEYLIENGASLSAFSNMENIFSQGSLFYPAEFIEFLVLNGLPADKLLESILTVNIQRLVNSETVIDYKLVELQKRHIEIAIKHSVNIDNTVKELSVFYMLTLDNEIIKLLLDSGLSPDILLSRAAESFRSSVTNSNNEVIVSHITGEKFFDLAIQSGANPNYTDNKSGLSVLEMTLISGNFELVDKLIEAGAEQKISTLGLFYALGSNLNLSFICGLQSRFPEAFSEKEIYDLFRAHGISQTHIDFVNDAYRLATEINVYKSGNHVELTEAELSILDDSLPSHSIESYKELEVKNNYGFTPLHLALLADKFDLAYEMVKAGLSMSEVSLHGISGLLLLHLNSGNRLTDVQAKYLNKITEETFKTTENVDIILPNGESLTDMFLGNENLRDQVLERSKDPLFAFFRKEADLLSFSKDGSGKVHIGISHGEGYWSTGVNAAARLIMQDHPNVEFHMVTQAMLEKGGDAFVQQFNGWINPGGGDSYPAHLKEFSKTHWNPYLDTEHTYQYMLEKTEAFNIPYIGMCAGAQNFALYHGGYLYPLDGYDQGKHTITYKEGTLAHYQSMTSMQQSHALKTCEFPKIEYKGDTAHHFAAVSGKLGEGLELGAVSEHDVPMAYAHINGIRFATQFHPEHYYDTPHQDENVNHQKSWLENFIHLTKMHHNFLHHDTIHPQVFMLQVKARIDKCMIEEVCVNDQSMDFLTQELFIQDHSNCLA